MPFLLSGLYTSCQYGHCPSHAAVWLPDTCFHQQLLVICKSWGFGGSGAWHRWHHNTSNMNYILINSYSTDIKFFVVYLCVSWASISGLMLFNLHMLPLRNVIRGMASILTAMRIIHNFTLLCLRITQGQLIPF